MIVYASEIQQAGDEKKARPFGEINWINLCNANQLNSDYLAIERWEWSKQQTARRKYLRMHFADYPWVKQFETWIKNPCARIDPNCRMKS